MMDCYTLTVLEEDGGLASVSPSQRSLKYQGMMDLQVSVLAKGVEIPGYDAYWLVGETSFVGIQIWMDR